MNNQNIVGYISFISKVEKYILQLNDIWLNEDFLITLFKIFNWKYCLSPKKLEILSYYHFYNKKYRSEIQNLAKNFRGNSTKQYLDKLNKKFFDKLINDEMFAIVPGIIHTNSFDNYIIIEEIVRKQHPEQLDGFLLCNYKEILSNYKILSSSRFTQPKRFGEQEIGKRVCRFCNHKLGELNSYTEKTTSFNQKAHAISKSLENYTLFNNEECDCCNKYFGDSIEKDTNIFLKELDTFSRLACIHKNKFYPQNVYKTLCKFALSVIDDDYIKYFKNTISWIRSRKTYNQLPHVINFKINKNNNSELPYMIGEFRYRKNVFAFIIPLSSKESTIFTTSEKLKPWLELFAYPAKSNGSLIAYDFSCFQKTQIGRIINQTQDF